MRINEFPTGVRLVERLTRRTTYYFSNHARQKVCFCWKEKGKGRGEEVRGKEGRWENITHPLSQIPGYATVGD